MVSDGAAAAAGTWKLGDLTVNRVGFGTMRLPQTGAALDPDAVPRDREQALAVLRRAVELGVNHIDTAAFYFSRTRSANELVNRALAPYPDDLVIATKVGPRRTASGAWREPATPADLRGEVEENLRQLGRDHLDLVYLRVSGPGPVGEHFAALAELREAGLIRHLGLSAVGPERLAQARAVAPVVSVQNAYGLGHRPGQDAFVTACGEQGIAYVPFFSIAGAGRETGAGDGEDGEVTAVARAHGVSAAQVRLAWALRRGPHLLVIPGTGDPRHLADNVAAGGVRLGPDDLTRLDAVHRRS
jgi:aryl-alcohol dehydrogenase-like predicted oxidoreductase